MGVYTQSDPAFSTFWLPPCQHLLDIVGLAPLPAQADLVMPHSLQV